MHVKKFSKVVLIILLMPAFFVASCASKPYTLVSFDARAITIPVMLSPSTTVPGGRSIPIKQVSEIYRTGSTSTYGNYEVTTTTTDTKVSK